MLEIDQVCGLHRRLSRLGEHVQSGSTLGQLILDLVGLGVRRRRRLHHWSLKRLLVAWSQQFLVPRLPRYNNRLHQLQALPLELQTVDRALNLKHYFRVQGCLTNG